MKYQKPEMELIHLEQRDIVTESDLPIDPASLDEGLNA